MRAQQVGHLPTVAHLFGHHALQGEQVIVRRRVVQQVTLLLHRREFRVALVDDQVQEGVANPLVGDVREGGPFALALVMPELDVRHFGIAELGVEVEVAHRPRRQTDRLLPVAEVVDPVVEITQLADHCQRLLLERDCAIRSCASAVANSSCCVAISQSSIPSSNPAPLWKRLPFARASAGGACPPKLGAGACAPAASRSAATTRSNTPSASASAAGIMRALHTSSRACEGPTRRGKNQLPPQSGARPSFANTWPICAWSDAMR